MTIPSITSMEGAFRLDGMNAIITGGNRGLGEACALAFAEMGANCAILCRDMTKASGVIEELNKFGTKNIAYSCDVTSFESCKKAVADVVADFGEINILLNNSGITNVGKLIDDDESLGIWYGPLNVDLNGTVHMTYLVARQMREQGKGGRILNMTSNAGLMVNYGQPMCGYSSSKAAANHFTRCMACELAEYDITVNAIAPGYTDTDLSQYIPKETVAYTHERMCNKRFGKPIEVAALAVYLASPAAAQTTGTVAVIDGGYMLQC